MGEKGDERVKIRNYNGRSWISRFDGSGITIHITNAEVESVELKGSMLNVRVKESSGSDV